jgi:hypothetical protein
MKLSPTERAQLLTATTRNAPTPRAPTPPVSFLDFCRQLDALRRLQPDHPRPFITGNHWKL